MTLRRFPWKCPKNTDNSFKLFITQPTEEELQLPIYPTRERVSQSEPTSRMPSAPGQNSQSELTSEGASVKSAATTVPATSSNTAQVIKGPWRLLRLLPRETRHIIGGMLDMDPARRANLQQLLKDPWIVKTPHCTQLVGGKLVRADGHEHTLAAGGGEEGGQS
jgi:hypothetical protein